MARVDIVIPEPTPIYTEENQRQVTQSLRTMQDKLNTSYQQELASTGKTTVFTCPSDATVIVKSVYCANNDASSAVLVNMNLVDSSDSSAEYEFFRDDVEAKSQVNATPQGLNLEAGDSITVQAATGSNTIQGAISYAQIDRSQENG